MLFEYSQIKYEYEVLIQILIPYLRLESVVSMNHDKAINDIAQQAHNLKTTSYQRQCDVMTSH